MREMLQAYANGDQCWVDTVLAIVTVGRSLSLARQGVKNICALPDWLTDIVRIACGIIIIIIIIFISRLPERNKPIELATIKTAQQQK